LVAGNSLNFKQAGGVIAPFLVLEQALGSQEKTGLHEKKTEKTAKMASIFLYWVLLFGLRASGASAPCDRNREMILFKVNGFVIGVFQYSKFLALPYQNSSPLTSHFLDLELLVNYSIRDTLPELCRSFISGTFIRRVSSSKATSQKP
jgi:hypothetical protein